MWGGRRVPEVGFTDPGSGVEEEWKPANPGPELDPANGLYSRRQMPGGLEDLREELDGANLRVGISA